jgi:hypothetical protein
MIARIVADAEGGILSEWIALQKQAGVLQTGRIQEPELRRWLRASVSAEPLHARTLVTLTIDLHAAACLLI